MDITSANAAAVMTVDELFPAGFSLENFATDQSVTQDEETLAEVRTGVDGKLAGGFVPSSKVVHFSLEPCSPSVPYVDQLIKSMETNKRIYKIGMTVTIPAIGKVYTYENGILTTAKTFPDAKKVLDPQAFAITFESRTVQPL